ncbi:MAG: TolB family protein [Thermomicrobiales bacterium]
MTASSPRSAVRPHRAPRARLLVLLALLVSLAACGPFARTATPVVESVLPTPTVRPKVTPPPTVAGPPAPTPIAPPVGLAPGRTLAFVSDRDGQIDLWLTDITTGQLWRLTNDQAIESFPVWSPDGTMIAYVVEDQHENRNLWVLDLRTGIHRQLTYEQPPFDVRRAAWLRGGRALIYDTGKPFDRRPELRVVTLDNNWPQNILAPLLPDNGSIIWDWSTNGETVICAVGPQLGEPHIVTADAVPGASLHPDPAAPVGFAVELSPDGQYATYSAPPLSDDQTAWIYALATGQSWSLNDRAQNPVSPAAGTPEAVPGRRYEHDFAWLPDSQRLVFVHGAGGVTDGQGRLKSDNSPPPQPDGYVGLWVTDRAQKPENRLRLWLTPGPTDAAPRPSPDGRWIAYLSAAQPPDPAISNIWLVAVDAESDGIHALRNLTGDHGNNWSPAWMPLPNVGGNGR